MYNRDSNTPQDDPSSRPTLPPIRHIFREELSQHPPASPPLTLARLRMEDDPRTHEQSYPRYQHEHHLHIPPRASPAPDYRIISNYPSSSSRSRLFSEEGRGLPALQTGREHHGPAMSRRPSYPENYPPDMGERSSSNPSVDHSRMGPYRTPLADASRPQGVRHRDDTSGYDSDRYSVSRHPQASGLVGPPSHQPHHYHHSHSNQIPPAIQLSFHPGEAERMANTPSGSSMYHGGQSAQDYLPVDDQASSASKYECSFCKKGFNRPSSLKIHLNSHTGEKPFACPVDGCGRKFSVLSNMRRHARVHTNSPAMGDEAVGSSAPSSLDNRSSRRLQRRDSTASASSSTSHRSAQSVASTQA
ncbi:hypothetical protein BJ165DRAFT_1525240 [Panaeolus papilionaceus]|nr:hypothetical protein BJ165DRAFT_1525240 [Panaeolus papilionaceus]